MTQQATRLDQLCSQIGYTFASKKWLKLALTHRSAKGSNNERLEFLGDAVLGLIISDVLYKRFPKANEGDLSRLRSNLVCRESLANIAKDFQIGDYLQLGSGELKNGGKRRDSILADSLEAIIGAIFSDGGFEACEKCVLAWFAEKLASLRIDAHELKDPKSRLQEYAQGKHHGLPQYVVEGITGEPHNRTFIVRCSIEREAVSSIGVGSSRRRAEQSAAEAMLKQIEAARSSD